MQETFIGLANDGGNRQVTLYDTLGILMITRVDESSLSDSQIVRCAALFPQGVVVRDLTLMSCECYAWIAFRLCTKGIQIPIELADLHYGVLVFKSAYLNTA